MNEECIMAKYINEDSVRLFLEDEYNETDVDNFMTYLNLTADIITVQCGRWLSWEEQFPEKKVPKKNNLGVFCSVCHNHADNRFDYCPNCGAKMNV